MASEQYASRVQGGQQKDHEAAHAIDIVRKARGLLGGLRWGHKTGGASKKGPVRGAENICEPKIDESRGSVFLDENVGGCQIAMNDASTMQLSNCIDDRFRCAQQFTPTAYLETNPRSVAQLGVGEALDALTLDMIEGKVANAM